MKLPQGQETVEDLRNKRIQPGSKCCVVGCREGDVYGRKLVLGERSGWVGDVD